MAVINSQPVRTASPRAVSAYIQRTRLNSQLSRRQLIPTQSPSQNESKSTPHVPGAGQEARIAELEQQINDIDKLISGYNETNPWDPEWPEKIANLREERDSTANKINLLKTGDTSSPEVKAITSKEASPYVHVNSDGSYSVDTDLALAGGLDTSTLRKLGISNDEIESAQARQILFKTYKTKELSVEDIADAIAKGDEAYLRRAGVSSKSITQAKALNIMRKYKTAKGYDLIDALNHGVKESTIKAAGFDYADLKLAKQIIAARDRLSKTKKTYSFEESAIYKSKDLMPNSWVGEQWDAATMGKPTFNKETGLWYDPKTNLYYDPYGLIFYKDSGKKEIAFTNFGNIIPENTIAGQLVISLTPVLGTVYFWKDMKTWEKVVSIIGDVLVLDSAFNAGRISTAVTKVILAPIKNLKGIPRLSKVIGKSDEIATVFKDTGLGEEYDDVLKAQLKYGDDYLEFRKSETILQTIERQTKPLPKSPYAKIYAEAISEAQLNYDKSLNKMRIAKITLEDNTMALAKKAIGKVGVDSPDVKEGFTRMSKDMVTHVESVADDYFNKSYLVNQLDDITEKLARAEEELAKLKTKFPTDSSKYADVAEEVMKLQSQKVMALAGDVENIQRELYATREFIDQAKKYLKQSQALDRAVWEEELTKAIRNEKHLEAKFDAAVKTYDVEASRFKNTYGKAPVLTPTKNLPLIKGGGTGTTTNLTGVIPAVLYAIARTFPVDVPIPKRDVQKIVTYIEKIVGATVPDISRAEMTNIDAVIKNAIKLHNEAINKNLPSSEVRQQVVAQVSQAAAIQTATEIKEDTKLQTETKVAVGTLPKTSTPIKTGSGKKVEKIILPKEDEKETKEKITYPEGTVAWKQGIGYWRWEPPYKDENRHFSIEKPKGVIITPDARTAFDTIQTYKGKSPGKLPKFDMGIVDVKIENAPQAPHRSNRQAIHFTQDRQTINSAKRNIRTINKPTVRSTRLGNMIATNMGNGSVLGKKKIHTLS